MLIDKWFFFTSSDKIDMPKRNNPHGTATLISPVEDDQNDQESLINALSANSSALHFHIILHSTDTGKPTSRPHANDIKTVSLGKLMLPLICEKN